MIGLSEIKAVTDQIVAAYKLQKIRDGYGFKDEAVSRHMVFTGNPGSAKTTVARLIADILTEEGILKTGALVECGRADLVGQYVGWTAREVRDKFKEASGGILFIDEAYSLVEDHKTFGMEAINTIAQEMENHRGDVIVIFAGYPEKMAEFLDQNEGLRSRIAFHLSFPDYNEEELMSILQLMAKNRGIKIDNKAKERWIC
ncbi:AAA family ATPase [Butyrivibrio sp. MC2013]|uniref:AAA family ATPase n=1 Tax=Butyrivibrio sp. MC2013 TaxID=1280686 RepID=UPI00040263A9|nr:AAA family ATPase [Butyrivibrio sp. MC2013]